MHKPLQHFLAVDRRKCKRLLILQSYDSRALTFEKFGQQWERLRMRQSIWKKTVEKINLEKKLK